MRPASVVLRTSVCFEQSAWPHISKIGMVRALPHPQGGQPALAGLGVDDGILDIPMAKIVLDQPRFRALFGEIEAGCLYRDQSA